MQDINQQLYEKKETPSEFIPVYAVVFNLDETGNNVTCNKTLEEALAILKSGGSCILTKIYGPTNNYVNTQYATEISISDNELYCTFIIKYMGIYEYRIEFTNEGIYFESNPLVTNAQIINSYNIQSIMNKVINNGTSQEVLSDINSIFGGFANFKVAISKSNSVFYNDYGKVNVRISNDCIVLFWAPYNVIEHVVINEDGSYIHNTTQIVDQTLYRLSALTVEPIVNPKIWIGTAVQYAAIAQKDNNTTYIVKSDA